MEKMLQALSIVLNLVSACGVVFANKAVLSICGFRFSLLLSCIHTSVSLCVATILRVFKVVQPKPVPSSSLISLAVAFSGYIILCNVSLALNTVGFYQLLKIAGAPTMMFMEAFNQRRPPDLYVAVCVCVTCVGIGIATVADSQVLTNLPGLLVGICSVLVTSQYGIWIGSMCKLHEVTALQLLDQYLPYATSVMAACVAFFVALQDWGGSVECELSAKSALIIGTSAILGVMVTYSTFMVITSTSALTYSVVGHVKTLAILIGGVIFFHDEMTPTKSVGTTLALLGVIAYTHGRSETRLDAVLEK